MPYSSDPVTPNGDPTRPHPAIVLGVTASISAGFFTGQAKRLREAGFDVTIVASPGEEFTSLAEKEGVHAVAIPMEREIAPLADLVSLFRIVLLLRRKRPAITDFGTPKAGLLGVIASWLTRVPCRVYTLRGLRIETLTGLKRALLFCSEWIACHCATRVRCVSSSLRDKVVALGIARFEDTVVLAGGTCNGIDVQRFLPGTLAAGATEHLRSKLGIPAGAPVVGFVGRFTRDKGISELVDAFEMLKAKIPHVCLLLVGDFEAGDPVAHAVRTRIEQDPSIFQAGFVLDTAPYYHLMDLVALPTYREGFPGVPLEAGAAAKPVVTTDATGALESVVEGVTGLITPVGDSRALAAALERIISDPVAAERMGLAGRERVVKNFSRELVVNAVLTEYGELMQSSSTMRQHGWRSSVKRSLDFVVAFVGLILLSPVLLVTAGLVLLTMGKPIFFRQQRPGKDRVPFTLFKFRSMRNAPSFQGVAMDGERLTRFGRFLRASSLDELPQLWNVLLGDLSLVGPRPLLMEYLDRYTPEQRRRHDVMPGITGWAQINGRNALSWAEKFRLDVWYVDHWSLHLDLLILAKTLWRVVKRDGIAQTGQATMPEFFCEERANHRPVAD